MSEINANTEHITDTQTGVIGDNNDSVVLCWLDVYNWQLIVTNAIHYHRACVLCRDCEPKPVYTSSNDHNKRQLTSHTMHISYFENDLFQTTDCTNTKNKTIQLTNTKQNKNLCNSMLSWTEQMHILFLAQILHVSSPINHSANHKVILPVLTVSTFDIKSNLTNKQFTDIYFCS